jgi:hypothetical protein
MENFMKRLSTVIFPGIAIVALAALFLRGWVGATAATVAQVTRSSRACGVWHTVASPNVGTSTNFLNGITAISAKNVWAVGTEGNGNGGLTLVEHWRGTQWKVIASPDVNGSLSDSLSGVAAVAANNIWAVGTYYDTSNTQQTLIEHWNGTSWSIVHSPSSGQLYGVTALAANNVWAVGSFSGTSTNGYQTLIEHWNGSNWNVVQSPGTGSGQLYGLTALAANNVWAVGNIAGTNAIQTLVEHWNGSSWSAVSSPSPGLATNTLNGVTAIAANNIWAVGDDSSSAGPSAPFTPLVEHWNGSSWSVVTSPLQGTSDLLNGVAGVSASNLWAVGDYRSSIDPQGPYFTLIEHWNGTSWKVVKSPSPGSVASVLEAAVRVQATTSVWTVGYTQDSASQTLTQFNC